MANNANNPITITDNYNSFYTKLFGPKKIIGDNVENIKTIANKSLVKLKEENPGLLVFPEDQDSYGDGFDGDEKQICSLIEYPGGTAFIETSNVMGWISCRAEGKENRTELKIYSRFDSDLAEKENDENPGNKGKELKCKDDLFMYYLIAKVGGIHQMSFNFSKDSKGNSTSLLILLFPKYLKEAVNKGLYKEYRSFDHNDSNVRGLIDVNRHIRYNNPFVGNVAYRSREYTYDNSLTQLIRHTIEYISEQKFGGKLLVNDENTQACVEAIYQATPSYNVKERGNVIAANLRPKVHPFYTDYLALQRICLQILHEEGLSYGVIESDEKLHGILFDGAWLWESYVATLLKDCNMGFEHPDNIAKTGAFRMFKRRSEIIRSEVDDTDDFISEDRRESFPDFYNDDCVIDAKYKNLKKKVQREDLYQVISYMHTMPRSIGGYVYPYQQKEPLDDDTRKKMYRRYFLHGKEGSNDSICVIPFFIPYYDENKANWLDFSKKMQEEEENFKTIIKEKILKD